MANGHATLLLLDPKSTPATDQPAAAPTSTGIEVTKTALAVAAAAEAICKAVGDFQLAGAMSPAIRELSGTTLAKVCEIRLAGFDDIDCTVAGAEAKRILRQRHGAAWLALHGTELPAVPLDTLVGWVFEVTDRVVANERRLSAN